MAAVASYLEAVDPPPNNCGMPNELFLLLLERLVYATEHQCSPTASPEFLRQTDKWLERIRVLNASVGFGLVFREIDIALERIKVFVAQLHPNRGD